MKKVFVVVAMLAIALMSAPAFADVTVSGSVDFRGWANNNFDLDTDATDHNRYNQSRVSMTLDGKMGDAKAKLTIWNDWESWGGLETSNGQATTTPTTGAGGAPAHTHTVSSVTHSTLAIKEAWADFPLFGIFRAKGGHMPLQLSNGWFFKHMYRGDDAWVVYGDAGGAHFGFVNIKIAEAANNVDSDIYALVFTQKAGDSVFGANLSRVVFAKPSAAVGSNILNNLGLHATVAAGPAKLNVEFDYQMGKNKTTTLTVNGVTDNPEYKGNQLVITGALPIGPMTLNFTAGRGTGNKTRDAAGAVTSTDVDQVQTYLDITNKPGYTFVYDYLVKTAAGATKAGFANTTALGVGVDAKVGKIGVGVGFFYLQATEKTNLNNAVDALGNRIYSADLGMELDAKVMVPMAEGVTWTTYLGYFAPGDAYKIMKAGVAADPDEATSIMTVLTAAIK